MMEPREIERAGVAGWTKVRPKSSTRSAHNIDEKARDRPPD